MKKSFLTLMVISLMAIALLLGGCASTATPTPSPTALPTTATPEPSATPETSPAAPVDVRIAALKGPTAMGMVKMMEDADAGLINDNYDFTIAAAIDEITPKIVQGQVDITAVPANLASVLYNNTKGQVTVLAVNTLGVLYIVESGDTIKTVEDLRGKTIYASGKGATPEYALNYMLTANGIDPVNDVTIEFKAEHAEAVAVLAQQENAIAMLPQPFVTTAQMKNENIRIALDMTAEWDKVQSGKANPSSLITGVVIVRNEFLQAHPEAVAAFMDTYKASVEHVNANLDDAARLIGHYDIIPEAVAKKALPYCNITFVEGAALKQQLGGYLSVLFDQNPQAIGGTLPDDAFYYNRENA